MVGIDGKDVVSLSSSVVSVSDTSAGSSAAAIGGRGMANVNITPHRAHLARDTHTHNFSRVHAAPVLESTSGQDLWICSSYEP